MMPNLNEELDDARARVTLIERRIAAATCTDIGHDMVCLGGCNAGCDEHCVCSVPVCECRRCGDCDYGETPEADEIRARCAETRSKPAPDGECPDCGIPYAMGVHTDECPHA